MKIVHVDPTVESVAHVADFFAALGLTYTPEIDHIFEEPTKKALGIIKSGGDELIILISHRAPYVSDIKSIPASNRPHVIRIGISNDSPVLRLETEFNDGIAEINWPEKSGSGLSRLGNALRSNLPVEVGDEPTKVLKIMNEHLLSDWVSDDRIAAYLLRVVSSSDDEYRHALNDMGLSKFEGYTLDKLLSSLLYRLPGVEP